ncbi:hypothetical protein Zmor_020490 [Zophobas morio]|uniref:Fibrinogen C-terminal domain-containing protein n=1 Tax=Zophobas morio TaxID=2755281 RepID=A0AA38M9P1_9CUCU|nr:hypothetical protein Zmor_020490 [Zophobas morio]
MQMIRKSVFTLYLLLNLFLFIRADNQDTATRILQHFDVVSTSQRPSDSLKIDQALTKQLENFQQNLTTKLKALEATNLKQLDELTHRVEALEAAKTSTQQVVHRLEALEFENNRLKFSELTKTAQLDQLTRRLKALENKNSNLPRNCREIKERGYDISTTYLIKPDFAPNAIKVLCDLEKRGGGWTYILNRFDGSQSFGFDLEEYKKGFGNLSGEFWLGLDNIHYLTGYKNNELLVELEDWKNRSMFAHYGRFSVGSEDEDYVMTAKEYSGTATNGMIYSDNMKFSTKTKDRDLMPSENCAEYLDASWWFRDCTRCLLTGKYSKGERSFYEERQSMFWSTNTETYILKKAKMMVRPRLK